MQPDTKVAASEVNVAISTVADTLVHKEINEEIKSTLGASQQGASASSSLKEVIQAKGKAYGQTGPKSVAGKNHTRWNALKDGATAKSMVLPFEDERAYKRHIKEVEHALSPVNYVEEQMVREYAEGLWRLIRHEKRGAYERDEILNRLTPQLAAQMLGLKERYVSSAPDYLIDLKHKIPKQAQAIATKALDQYQHLIANAKGIANFNLVWRQYQLLFEQFSIWLLDHNPGSTPVFTHTGKDLNLPWQQNPQKLLQILEHFANHLYFVEQFEHFKPAIRVWIESWFFLQKTEMRKLEHVEQLLLKERNYTYGILERLLRFRKSNVFLNGMPSGLSLLTQKLGNPKNEMSD